MLVLRNMIIKIRSLGFKKWDAACVVSLNYVKCDKVLFIILLTVISSFNKSNSLDQQDHNNKHHSYGGHFVSEEEAEAIAIEAKLRLAKIPCNFTTKANCIIAEHQKLSLPIKHFLHRSQQDPNEIVVSWLPDSGIINKSIQSFSIENGSNNTRYNTSISSNNVREKLQSDFYIFDWIFELLACMMLASAFEICLLVLRNLRNIRVAFSGFWSVLNVRLQKWCNTCAAISSSNKTDQQRKGNVVMGDKRTFSYIFAILTWRASQTARSDKTSTEDNSKDETSQNTISYGQVTTMGDLLLLILFTHVYYQRQKFDKEVHNDVSVDPEQLLNGHKEKDQSSSAYQKFYDKQNNNNNNATNEQNYHRRAANKRCSHFCGNMYQQILSLQEQKPIFTNLSPCTTKIPNLTYCSGLVWHTCCFCQYSCRSCCYCCSNCKFSNQRCYIHIPLYNSIFCCCFCKTLKFFHDVDFKYCCYLCCWKDVCYLSDLNSHSTNRCCCHFYCLRICNRCYFYNALENKTSLWIINLLLLNKIKNTSSNVYSPTTDHCVWKLKWSNQSYSILYEVDGQKYSIESRSMFLYKPSFYQFAVNVISTFFPQYMLTIKNYQTFLKWKKLHVAAVLMALIVICASSAGANYNHQHFYSSLFNRCNKHFSQYNHNKKRRRRRRRRHQHCKAYKPQHYFYTTLIQYVKKQKTKKMQKRIVNKLHKNAIQALTPITAHYEYFLAPPPSKAPMVRAIRRVRGAKPNIVWLLIGLIWFEGPKIVSCNVIINYQNHQQHEQQQQHQPQAGNNHKEATTNAVNSNFEYKIENFNQLKTKNSSNNNNSNNSNNNSNNSNNNNKSKSKNASNSSNNNSTSNSDKSSTILSNNIHLSVSVIPIISNIHFKHYCNSNYHQKLIRSTQRVQRALKANPNLDTSVTSSAYLNYNNVNDELDSKPMPSSAFQTSNEESHAQSDLMRLESIKHQILFKLGLTRKPNVPHPLPKQFIWDTIYRADGIKSFHEFAYTNNFQDHQHFTTQQNDPHWLTNPSKASNLVPMRSYRQRQQHEDHSEDLNDFDDGGNNIKLLQENINVLHKKYGKQQTQQTQIHSKGYNIVRQKGATTRSTSRNMNQLLYTTTNRNKLINYTNKTVNNFTILKQSKHQQFHKNSQHSIIHQQQQKNRRQYEQTKQHKNNNNKKSKINNINNNVNNSNNNNIIMVQKQLHDNNKYIEEAKKFTYLTDINSSDDSLNSMEEYQERHSDDNKQNQYQHRNDHVHPLQLHTKHGDILKDKTSEDYQRFNVDNFNDFGRNVGMERSIPNDELEILHHDESDNDKDQDDDDGVRFHRNNHYMHENYASKLDAFDENEDFFGSTQEIITFAEKGKMYKNHRLVEFSHQSSEKRKQKLHVKNAEIHIRIDKISLKKKSRAGSGIKRKRLKIWIFQLIENNYTYKGLDHAAQFCASFEVDTLNLGWKKFDITTTVKQWYSQREGEKLKLLIDCTGCGKMYTVHLFNNDKEDISVKGRHTADEKRNKNMTDISSEHFYNVTHHNDNTLPYNETLVAPDNDGITSRSSLHEGSSDEEDALNSSRPFLVLHIEARRQRRVRRRAINCNGALHGQCCKESFYVSFKALGWDDWIIAPRGYFANYCRGDCTGPYRTPDTFQTFHAHFIEEYRKMGLLNGMQPCCAPIKFSSMSLIYYGDEGIIKRDLPKMVVDECGCP